MRSSKSFGLGAAALVALLGCDAAPAVLEGSDAGLREDAAPSRDTGADGGRDGETTAPDARAVDAGGEDAGASDASFDADLYDAALSDVGAPDTGPAHPRDLDILAVNSFGPADRFLAILDDWGTVTPVNDPELTLSMLRAYDLVVFGVIPSALASTERAALGVWVSLEGGRAIVIGGQDRDRTTTHSITSVLAMPLDLTATEDFTGTPTWWTGHVAGIGILPPFMRGAHHLGAGSDTRVHAEAISDTRLVVSARFESDVGGGRAYAWLDEGVTIDAFWISDHDLFWFNVLSWVTR